MRPKKLLLILCGSDEAEAVREILEAHQVHGFTEIEGARGAGITGLHLGTRAFPGTATLLFSVVDVDRAPEVIAALRSFAVTCPPGEGVKVFVMDAAEAV
jgi:Nitrogen regulatory protein P-II